jgi:cell shape-determining protein MreC
LNIQEENLNEKEVKEEVEQYKKEKEKIRKLLDSISSTKNGILNKVMDYGFRPCKIFCVNGIFS